MMRGLILFLIGCPWLASLGAIEKEPTGVEKEGFNGRVRAVMEKHYQSPEHNLRTWAFKEFDSKGRLFRTDARIGIVSLYRYDAQGRLTSVYRYTKARKPLAIVRFEYDEAGNAKGWTEENAAGRKVGEQRIKRDDKGRVILETMTRFRDDDQIGFKTETKTQYQAKGKIIEIASFNGFVTVKYIHKYNLQNKKLESVNRGPDGNIESRATFQYNEAGELTGQLLFDSKGAKTGQLRFKYDETGTLSERQDLDAEGRVFRKRLFKYDSRGNKVKQIFLKLDETTKKFILQQEWRWEFIYWD